MILSAHYDVIIAGAGLVGASLMVALQHTGLRIAVLETHVPVPAAPGGDSRPLTLNESSRRILETLGIWPDLAALAEPITTVHVSEENQFGVLRFRASEEKVPALGYVVPFDELQNLLYQRAAQNPAAKFISIQKLIRIQYQAEKISAVVQTLEGERTLTAELFVAADGTQSPARELAGITAVEKSHDDVALTITMELTQPHQHCAYERFTKQGIIAVLPLKNPQRCRIVWTLPRMSATDVSSWSDLQLAEHLRAAVHDRLGAWRVLERGKTFSLQTLLAQQQTGPGVVLLGNAAHTLYPVAAQGFNLGLRDAATLAEILTEARQQQRSLGSEVVLKTYVDWRSSDQRWISSLTSGISQWFDLQMPGLGTLRGAGLLATDLIPPLKRRLAKRLLGLAGKLPKLARGISI